MSSAGGSTSKSLFASREDMTANKAHTHANIRRTCLADTSNPRTNLIHTYKYLYPNNPHIESIVDTLVSQINSELGERAFDHFDRAAELAYADCMMLESFEDYDTRLTVHLGGLIKEAQEGGSELREEAELRISSDRRARGTDRALEEEDEDGSGREDDSSEREKLSQKTNELDAGLNRLRLAKEDVQTILGKEISSQNETQGDSTESK